MVKHGIVLLCDGPPWPKHDAQFPGHPLRRRMRACEREREERVRAREEGDAERNPSGSGRPKIGGIPTPRQFLSRGRTANGGAKRRSRGPSESRWLRRFASSSEVGAERGKIFFSTVAKKGNKKKSETGFDSFFSRFDQTFVERKFETHDSSHEPLLLSDDDLISVQIFFPTFPPIFSVLSSVYAASEA